MRRALAKLLPEDHRSVEKQNCKRQDNNGRPKYQNVCISFCSAAFVFDSVLAIERADGIDMLRGSRRSESRSSQLKLSGITKTTPSWTTLIPTSCMMGCHIKATVSRPIRQEIG